MSAQSKKGGGDVFSSALSAVLNKNADSFVKKDENSEEGKTMRIPYEDSPRNG